VISSFTVYKIVATAALVVALATSVMAATLFNQTAHLNEENRERIVETCEQRAQIAEVLESFVTEHGVLHEEVPTYRAPAIVERNVAQLVRDIEQTCPEEAAMLHEHGDDHR
jgi:hypothetical protein